MNEPLWVRFIWWSKVKINKSINLIYQKLIKRKPCESIRWEYLMWKNLVGSEPFAGVHCQHCMDQLLRCQERFTHFHSDKTKNQLICFELKVNLCKRGNRLPVAFISAVLACICILCICINFCICVYICIHHQCFADLSRSSWECLQKSPLAPWQTESGQQAWWREGHPGSRRRRLRRTLASSTPQAPHSLLGNSNLISPY